MVNEIHRARGEGMQVADIGVQVDVLGLTRTGKLGPPPAPPRLSRRTAPASGPCAGSRTFSAASMRLRSNAHCRAYVPGPSSRVAAKASVMSSRVRRWALACRFKVAAAPASLGLKVTVSADRSCASMSGMRAWPVRCVCDIGSRNHSMRCACPVSIDTRRSSSAQGCQVASMLSAVSQTPCASASCSSRSVGRSGRSPPSPISRTWL